MRSGPCAESPECLRESGIPPLGSGPFRDSPDRFGLDSLVRNVNPFLAGGFGDFVTLGLLTLFSSHLEREREMVCQTERRRVLLGFSPSTLPLLGIFFILIFSTIGDCTRSLKKARA